MRDAAEELGIYVSVPFCRAKCSYCNFASGVFGAERMEQYIDRVCQEIAGARARAQGYGAELPDRVDTVYLGGGTPSLLGAGLVRRLFEGIRVEFEVQPGAEVTLECAPGQLEEATLDEFLRQGVNRVSFGVQSFVDREARAVGRQHTRKICLAEIHRMRAAGVENVNVDLIVGLPQQTAESWRESIEVAAESGAPHVSVYMLEVDEDSRLGREMMATGLRYGAGAVPADDAIADWYAAGCEWLEAAGVRQYEISNFARDGRESRHNMKYWRRDPYLGFGLDAHSMLRRGIEGVRWANEDDLEVYLSPGQRSEGHLRQIGSSTKNEVQLVDREQAFEEAIFLGLRMNAGVDLKSLRANFGDALLQPMLEAVRDTVEAGLLVREENTLRLTLRGRMASNEVFSRLLVEHV